MKLEQTKRGARVKGIAGDRPVEIIASRFFQQRCLIVAPGSLVEQ